MRASDHAAGASLKGGLTYSARLDHQTNAVPHLGKSRREIRPRDGIDVGAVNRGNLGDVHDGGRGSPPFLFDSRTFPGKPPYLRLEVIAATTTVSSRVRLKDSDAKLAQAVLRIASV